MGINESRLCLFLIISAPEEFVVPGRNCEYLLHVRNQLFVVGLRLSWILIGTALLCGQDQTSAASALPTIATDRHHRFE